MVVVKGKATVLGLVENIMDFADGHFDGLSGEFLDQEYRYSDVRGSFVASVSIRNMYHVNGDTAGQHMGRRVCMQHN